MPDIIQMISKGMQWNKWPVKKILKTSNWNV